jgi:hypothetical protein
MPGDVQVSGGDLEVAGVSAPILPLLILGTGAYLAWFAVKYWRGQGQAVWPSYPVKSVLQGKGIPARAPAATAAAEVTAYETGLASQQRQPGSPAPGPPSAPGSGQVQNAARMLLGRFGWDRAQMPPLISLWNRESGWSPTAFNPSGAYGVAQALGHARAGECATGPRSVNATTPGVNCAYGSQYGLSPEEARAANAGHWLPQVRWGLGYIRDRYGSPSAAWAHEQAANWY